MKKGREQFSSKPGARELLFEVAAVLL